MILSCDFFFKKTCATSSSHGYNVMTYDMVTIIDGKRPIPRDRQKKKDLHQSRGECACAHVEAGLENQPPYNYSSLVCMHTHLH